MYAVHIGRLFRGEQKGATRRACGYDAHSKEMHVQPVGRNRSNQPVKDMPRYGVAAGGGVERQALKARRAVRVANAPTAIVKMWPLFFRPPAKSRAIRRGREPRE